MSSEPASSIVYRFGIFQGNSATGELLRRGVRVKLQEQPFYLLLLLLENAGEIVTRESVRQRLWPANTFVEFDASLSVAVGKLRDALGDDANNPRFIETVPRRGYRFIAPVHRLAPTQIPQVVPSFGKDEIQATLPVALSQGKPRPFTAKHALLTCAVVLLLAAVFVFRSLPRHSAAIAAAGTSASRPQIRRSVAVLGFRNLPGRKDEDWLSDAFTEMLSTELVADGSLRLVSDEDVARAKRELALGDQETLAKATLQRLRMNTGADVVVVGSYTPIRSKDGDRIRLDIRVQDTANGETIAEDAVTESEEDLFAFAIRAGAHLRTSLGMSVLPLDTSNAVRASLPSNQVAVRLYSEGKAKLWAFDFVGARNLLVEAVNADPNFPLSHSALSDTWWHLGYRSKATAEAKRAMELSGTLPQEERLLIEGSYRGTIGDWPRAVEVYRSLFQIHPDSLEYGLHLAGAQYHVKPPDALFTLKTLRQLPSPLGDDARIDLLEASARVDQDFAAAHAAAERAIVKGAAQGSPLMVARGYGILCQQGASIGVSTQEAVIDCEKARQSYASAGDRNNEARTLNDFAGLYFQRGNILQAESMWREAESEFRLVGDTEGLAATSNNIGDALLLQGNLGEAEKMFKESIPNYQAVEDKVGLADAVADLGDLQREQGNLDVAAALYRQAEATALEVDDKSAIATVLQGVGDVLMDRGDLPAARKSYEDSLARRNQTGEKQAAAETQVALAQVLIEEGRAADAEVVLRERKQQFHQEQQADEELALEVALIRALLAQGKQSDAKVELEQAQPFANKTQNFLARLQLSLASARVLLTSDHPESPRPQLERILKEASGHRFIGMEMEARLALAELEKKSGHHATAQTQLTSLEKAANAKGYGLIARKAAAAWN
jgi:eukaryotic-like serine/threonine-protein kinase